MSILIFGTFYDRKLIKTVFNPNYWLWAAMFWRKYRFSTIFGPERKVQRRTDEAKYVRIYRNVYRDVRNTNIMDQNRFQSKLLTLSRHFWRNNRFSAIFGPKMTVQSRRKGAKYVRIYRNGYRDVRNTNIIDQSRFQSKLLTLRRHLWRKKQFSAI